MKFEDFSHSTRFFDFRQEKYSDTLYFFASLGIWWEIRNKSDRVGFMPDSPPLPFDESFHRARFRLVHIEKVACWRGRVGAEGCVSNRFWPWWFPLAFPGLVLPKQGIPGLRARPGEIGGKRRGERWRGIAAGQGVEEARGGAREVKSGFAGGKEGGLAGGFLAQSQRHAGMADERGSAALCAPAFVRAGFAQRAQWKIGCPGSWMLEIGAVTAPSGLHFHPQPRKPLDTQALRLNSSRSIWSPPRPDVTTFVYSPVRVLISPKTSHTRPVQPFIP